MGETVAEGLDLAAIADVVAVPVEARAAPIESNADPMDVLLRLSGSGGLFSCSGAWAGGSVIIAYEPLLRFEQGDPYDILASLPPIVASDPSCRIGGGWFGYLGYAQAEERGVEAGDDQRLPAFSFGYYDSLLRWDEAIREWTFESLWSEGRAEVLERRWRQAVDLLAPVPPVAATFSLGLFKGPRQATHMAAVERAIFRIHAGDLFEVNICSRFEGPFSGAPEALFAAGVRRFAPAYAAYVGLEDGAVASLSPELFLRRRGEEVLTAPIKGTRPRTGDAALDARTALNLEASVKDRAENMMIVDLMRNDLSRVAEPGSVEAEDLFRLEAHPNVWHLVSRIRGRLSPDHGTADLLRASFPPGSVTGAPKHEAMSVSRELEMARRQVYTGAIGFVSPLIYDEFNVAIRTFEVHGGLAWIGTGGGITANSDPASEWQECLTKVVGLIEGIGGSISLEAEPPPAEFVDEGGLLDTAKVVDGVVIDKTAHELRLGAAQQELWPGTPSVEVRIPTGKDAGVAGRLRTIVRRSDDGFPEPVTVERTLKPLVSVAAEERLAPVAYPDWCYRLKHADREVIDRLEEQVGADHLPLVTDAAGLVLETTRGNVFMVQGDLVTSPPLDGRILAGVTRRRVALLARERGLRVEFAPIRLDQLAEADSVLTTQSIGGVRVVSEVIGVATFPAADCTVAHELRGAYEAWMGQEVASNRLLAGLPDALGRLQRAAAADAVGGAPTQRGRVLIVDNYDSFTYNLAHHLTSEGAQVEVRYNDDVRPVEPAAYDGLIVSPGPGGPAEAGRSLELIDAFANDGRPVLGICLGHQSIGALYGAEVGASSWPLHGTTSAIRHDGRGIFAGLPQDFAATRYHSLAVRASGIPTCLELTSLSDDQVVMGLRHRQLPVHGVQFHPESALTVQGRALLRNFLRML